MHKKPAVASGRCSGHADRQGRVAGTAQAHLCSVCTFCHKATKGYRLCLPGRLLPATSCSLRSSPRSSLHDNLHAVGVMQTQSGS